MSTDIRVALVYQQETGTATLRTALANAGVHIAIECKADALDGSAILEASVDAIVVNLDPELEELLDEVTEALDDAAQPVIYNDPAASSDLSGWDRARWLRHLSAKLKGRSDVTPPAPAGSHAIPSPPRRPPPPVAAVPVAVAVTEPAPAPHPVAETAPPPVIATVAAPEMVRAWAPEAASLEHVSLDLGFMDAVPDPAMPTKTDELAIDVGSGSDFGDIDKLFDDAPSLQSPAQSAPAATAPSATGVDSDFPDLSADFSFDQMPATIELSIPPEIKQTAVPVAAADDSEFSMDALFAESAEFELPAAAAPPPEPSQDAPEGDFFLDALFDAEPETSATAAVPAGPVDDGLADLDALFREFEASQDKPAAPAAATGTTPLSGMKKVESKSAPMDWSLEPVAEPPPKHVESDTPVTEWRLDGPAPRLPIVDKGPLNAAMPAAAKAPGGPQLPADLEASLALADLKLLDDDFSFDAPPAPTPAAGSGTKRNDFMDLGSSLSLVDDSPVDGKSAAVSEHELALAELDFALDLGDLSDADESDLTAPSDAAGSQSFDAGLDDLDGLFEPVTAAPVTRLNLPDLNRVFVLGASIGGPEAIKAFLTNLPSPLPAAFIIAQHMGAEFLEMMALQMDAATALSVRCPKSGEQVRHGDVLVAPVGEQLSIDERGAVRLSAANGSSPYSPSIDQLVHDAADRFGDHATLILFSGMGSDALEGGRYLTDRGGQVWAQDAASCVISSMIDAAKAQSLVRFEGTPVQLAERVVKVLS